MEFDRVCEIFLALDDWKKTSELKKLKINENEKLKNKK